MSRLMIIKRGVVNQMMTENQYQPG